MVEFRGYGFQRSPFLTIKTFRDLPSRYWPSAAFRVCNCPADLDRRRRLRVQEIVEHCAGTAQGYEQELDEWEENDVALLEMLDDELFTCEECGWCCATDTRSDCEDGDFCDECRPSTE